MEVYTKQNGRKVIKVEVEPWVHSFIILCLHIFKFFYNKTSLKQIKSEQEGKTRYTRN